MSDTAGRAAIKSGAIVIRLPIKNLAKIVEGSWASGYMDTRLKVTNPQEFADELVCELNREAEDGTTRVHKMFDGAISEAFEQGAFGIEEHENQEG